MHPYESNKLLINHTFISRYVHILTESVLFVRFTDNIAAVAENEHQLEGLLNILDETFKKIHLKINLKKTKILITYKITPISKI